MTDHDSAGTAAELDEIERNLRAMGAPYEGEAAEAIAALRKQLDEALMQASGDKIILARALDQAGADAEHDEKVIEALRADNAKKDAALRKIGLIAPNLQSRYPDTAKALVTVIDAALTPASQEAPASPSTEEQAAHARAWIASGPAQGEAFHPLAASPKGVHIEHTLAASPSPGLREPTDEDWAALEASGAGGARVRRVRAPSPGLREAVIEECARLVREKRLRLPEPEDRTEFGNGRHSMVWEIEQDLVALSRSVSEREDGQ